MLEAISLDTRTMIIKSDEETDFSEIINFIIKKDKRKDVDSFLRFVSQNRIADDNFKFNRVECYDR
jgi:ssRNA-specific RNase YbeY (16S rRNA maturation enzyme)